MSTHHLSRGTRAWRLSSGPLQGRIRAGHSWHVLAFIAPALVFVVAFIAFCVQSMNQPPVSVSAFADAETVSADSDVSLPLATHEDGRVRFYRRASAGGGETRFFAVRTPDGVVRTALDACESCYRARRGFRQSGDHVLCKSCNRAIPIQLVGSVRTGCNPIPLDHVISGDRITFRASALDAGGKYF